MEEYEKLGHMIPISGNSSRSAREGESNTCETVGGDDLGIRWLRPSGGLRASSNSSRARTQPRPTYYLPNHGVLKPDSITTKLRVVFNGSSKTTSGNSLNDLMHTGENLLLDITKMYRQIKVHEDDWDFAANSVG